MKSSCAYPVITNTCPDTDSEKYILRSPSAEMGRDGLSSGISDFVYVLTVVIHLLLLT